MLFRILIDLTIFIHFGFAIFAAIGGLFALRWRTVIIFHLPACIWAALIEFSGWICPLTPLENWFRIKGAATGYQNGYLDPYILPILYPENLTRGIQIVLGILVITANAIIYGIIVKKAIQNKKPDAVNQLK